MKTIPLGTIVQGDSAEVLRDWPEASVSACITDPPYGLHFIGQTWDQFGAGVGDHWKSRERAGSMHAGKYDHRRNGEYQAEMGGVFRECWRLLKPGGHLLSFGGYRTFHRLACAIEDAGFEIRDCLCWLFGNGFPKSHNLQGAWAGWGTGLKPGWTPILMARKPFSGTVAENVIEHGTGALYIQGTLIGTSKKVPRTFGSHRWFRGNLYNGELSEPRAESQGENPNIGRWPVNVAHDGSPEVMEAFAAFGEEKGQAGGDSQSGRHSNGFMRKPRKTDPNDSKVQRYDAPGSAARFFFQAPYSDEDLSWNLGLVSSADGLFDLRSESVVSVLVHAVNAALPVGVQSSVCTAPSMSATASELKQIFETVTQAIHAIEAEFWCGLPLGNSFLNNNRAPCVVSREQTGITTITINHWKSDGSAVPVTFSITPRSGEAGVPASARFNYCAKVSRGEREAGLFGLPDGGGQRVGVYNSHPT